MNALLLSQIHSNPKYINHFYVDLAGNITSGILLQTIMKYSLQDCYFTVSVASLLQDTNMIEAELYQALRKINKLPFLEIENHSKGYTFFINSKEFNSYLGDL